MLTISELLILAAKDPNIPRELMLDLFNAYQRLVRELAENEKTRQA